MIIHNFYLFRVPVSPHKADAPLLIDTDAMLSFTGPFKASSRFDEGRLKSSNLTAASIALSFMKARC